MGFETWTFPFAHTTESGKTTAGTVVWTSKHVSAAGLCGKASHCGLLTSDPHYWRWWACFCAASLQVLTVILLVLGHSLQCYSCINQVNCTSVVSCSRNQDACLFVKAVPLKFYHQCWKFEECSFELIAKALGEKELHYDCCQKNLCNKSGGTSISEKTPLLLTLLLVAVCRFSL